MNNAEGRWRAAEVIAEHPQASLREIARLSGISPATASDVRRRIQSGESPAAPRPTAIQSGGLPAASRPTAPKISAAPTSAPHVGEDVRSPFPEGHRPGSKAPPKQPDPGRVLEKLQRDPSLRLKEEGRNLLRLLQQNAAADWFDLTAAIPPHCTALVGSLARQYADFWLKLAQHLAELDRLATD